MGSKLMHRTGHIKMHPSLLRFRKDGGFRLYGTLCLFIVIEQKPIKAGLRLGKLAGCCQYNSADIVATLDTSVVR